MIPGANNHLFIILNKLCKIVTQILKIKMATWQLSNEVILCVVNLVPWTSQLKNKVLANLMWLRSEDLESVYVGSIPGSTTYPRILG